MVIFFVHPSFLYYLIGPLLYWYFRSVLNDQTRFRKQDLWHILPAFIYLVSTIPYLLLSAEEKTANAVLLTTNILNLKFIRASVLYEFIHPGLLFISRPTLVLIYAFWSLLLFIRYLKRRNNTAVFSQQRYMVAWLTVLLGFVFILTISHLIAMLDAYACKDLRIFFTLRLLQLFSGIGLTGLLISPLFFPSILYGMPRIPVSHTGASAVIQEPMPETVIHTQTGGSHLAQVHDEVPKPVFEVQYLKQIGNKLDHCMETLQPYLQHDCNLAYMAKLTAIPAHHLAYFFREEKQQSFNDYRNEWRIRHAKNLIRQGKTKELTLEAIGLLSGFSTRNTFYTAFKKSEGVSPSGYPTPAPPQEGRG